MSFLERSERTKNCELPGKGKKTSYYLAVAVSLRKTSQEAPLEINPLPSDGAGIFVPTVADMSRGEREEVSAGRSSSSAIPLFKTGAPNPHWDDSKTWLADK